MTAPVRPYRADNPFAEGGGKTYRPENPFASAPATPEPGRPSFLGTQARATVAGVGGMGLRTAGRVARAVDTVLPRPLRSNMGERFDQMATGLEDTLTPTDPQRAAEFRSGTAGAGLASELVKYLATGRGAAALAPGSPMLAGAMGAMGLGAVEDAGSTPDESVASMLAQGATLAGADRTATFLNEQAQSAPGRMTVGALLGLVPDAAIRAPGMVRGAVRNRAARGAVPGADYTPPPVPEGQKLLPPGQYEMPGVREPITDPRFLLPEAGVTTPRPTVQYDAPAGPGLPGLSPEGRLAREMEALRATPDDIARYRTARDGGRVPSPTGQTARRTPPPARPRGAALADEVAAAEREAIRLADEAPIVPLRDASGRLRRNLKDVPTDDIEREYTTLLERQSMDEGELSALRDRPEWSEYQEMGRGMREDRAGVTIEGTPISEMAQALGLNAGRVRQRERVIKRLAAELEKRSGDESTAFPFGANLQPRPGTANPEVLGTLAGSGVGGLAGAAADDENPMRGGLAGALAGGTAGRMAPRFAADLATLPPRRTPPSAAEAGLAEVLARRPAQMQKATELDALLRKPTANRPGFADFTPSKGPSVVDDITAKRMGLPRDIQAGVNTLGDERRWMQAVTTPGAPVVLDKDGVVGRVISGAEDPVNGLGKRGMVLVEYSVDGARVQRLHSATSVSPAAPHSGNRSGAARPEVLGAVAGAGVGALADPEDPVAAGLAGAAVGAGATAVGRKMFATKGTGRTVQGSTPALSKVGATINAGDREVAGAPAWMTPAERVYTDVVSETFPLVAASRLAGGEAGAGRMKAAIAQAQGSGQVALQYARDVLAPILRSAGKQGDDVRSLVKARRDLDIRTKGGAAKSTLTDDELRQAIRDGESTPAVKDAADRLTALHRDLLRLRHEAGLLTDDGYKAIVDSEDFYTPFVREFAAEASELPGAKGRRWQVSSSGVAKMDRTAEAIAQTADPLEVAATAISRTFRDIGRQNVQNVLTEFADAGNLPLVKRVVGDPPTHGRTYTQVVNGEKVSYEVTDKDLFDAIATQDPRVTNIFVRIAQGMKRVKQGGITLMPDFAIANVVRDLGQSGVQRPDVARAMRETAAGSLAGGVTGAATADNPEDATKRFLVGLGFGAAAGAYARPLADTFGAMRSIVTNDQAYRDFLKAGASTEGFYVRTPKDAREVLERLQREGVSTDDIVNPKRWVQALQYIGSVGEQGNRLAAFNQVRARGASLGDAAFEAQDRTLRFANVGRATKGLAAVTPFWNAKVQGWDKLGRMLRNPKTYPLAGAMLTAPSVALWQTNKDNPEYWERPQWERNLFWLIPKGEGQTGFWRVPKPFELGYLFASLPERMLDYAAQTGALESAAPKVAEPGRALARAAGDMATSTFEGTVPIPTAVELPAQLALNRDFFRNRNIVQRPNLPAGQQVGERTSAVARQAGKVGVSPERADFVLQDIAGTAGRQALGVTDALARRLGIDAPDAQTVDRSFAVPQRFQTKEYAVTESERTARDRLDRLDTVFQGWQTAQRSGNAEDATAYREKHQAQLRERAALNDARLALNRVRDERGQVLRNPRLSEDQKAERLKQLRQRALVISRRIQSYEAPE